MAFGVVFSATAQAAPGDLDPTFSGDGKQTTDFGIGGRGGATATVRQPDGKIIAVGWAFRGSAGDEELHEFGLARYNPNGSLDTSFSGDGLQKTNFADGATAVALQADGKIVVVGQAVGGDFALARYKPNGSLDPTFSGDGKQTTDFGSGTSARANGVAIQANGKIVVVGNVTRTSGGFPGSYFALARYNPNGSLDPSFSGDGKRLTDLGGSDIALAVLIQGDGKIVAVGGGGPGGDFALARYNPNGSLDPSFSGDGKQTTDFGGGDSARGAALSADGKIVAAGQAVSGDFALARYNPNGSLDPSFSGDGRQTTDFFGSFDDARGVALQDDGKIVAVGVAWPYPGDFALARYNPNGSLDPSFSGDGKQTTDLGGFDQAGGVVIQGGGKIVAVGEGGAGPAGFPSSFFALARYNPNGSLDPSFSGDGRQTTDFGGSDGAFAVAIQADGKIVTVGYNGGGGFALARHNPNGSLDPSFSGDGRQRTVFSRVEEATGVAIQADGKIVAVGRADSGFALARYNPNGSLDPTFSGDGKQVTNLGDSNGATGVAIQSNGKIVVVGDAVGVGGDFALARYNPNGSLDTSFSGDGRQTTDFSGSFDRATGVALQHDGKIVAVGEADGGGGGDRDPALARYNSNGSLDPSFSGDGKQTTNLGIFEGATGVALQADGKIVAVAEGALLRYNPNGSLDPSFSGDGRQTTGFGATEVAIQASGKIVAVGGAVGVGGDFGLARYNPNGSLDPSFSGDGKQTTDFFGDFDDARAVAIQGDGKIVAVGTAFGPAQTDFALARYLGG
jgi:uncharacterized delta-60 repeat protein